MTAALEGGEWSASRPGRTLTPGKTRYPFYWRLVGPQGRSERAENLVPTGIRSRTVQPVVSHYIDWATGPTPVKVYMIFERLKLFCLYSQLIYCTYIRIRLFVLLTQYRTDDKIEKNEMGPYTTTNPIKYIPPWETGRFLACQKNFYVFHWTRRFIAMFTNARYWALS